MNGAALSRNSVFATVVVVIEKMKQIDAVARQAPPANPARPARRKVVPTPPRSLSDSSSSNARPCASER